MLIELIQIMYFFKKKVGNIIFIFIINFYEKFIFFEVPMHYLMY